MSQDALSRFELAGLGRRFVARLIDGLIVVLIDFGFYGLLALFDAAGLETFAAISALLFLLSLVFSGPVYETVLIGDSGQTVGKRAVKIKVVRLRDGNKPGYGAALGRASIVFASWIVPFLFLVVFPWALINERKQGCHDLAAGTVVVRAK